MLDIYISRLNRICWNWFNICLSFTNPVGWRLEWTCRRSPLRFPVLPTKNPIDFPHDKMEEKREDVDDWDEKEGQQTSQANHVGMNE